MVKRALQISGSLFLSKVYLSELGVSDKCMKHWSDRKNVARCKIEDMYYFGYSSMPSQTKEKLPDQETLLADIKVDQYNEATAGYVRSLEYQKKECFAPHYNTIRKSYPLLPKEKVREFAERWAVWAWIIEGRHKANEHLVAAYQQVMPGHFRKEKLEVNIICFCQFRKRCQDNGIEVTIVDKRALRENKSRITAAQLSFLKGVYEKPQKFTTREAHTKLIAYCKEIKEEAYSLASVKLYFKEFERNTKMHKARYGDAAARKKMQYASLEQVKHRNTQWSMDGWTLPFWVLDEDKYNRYVLYIVRDNHSRKILSYGVSASEDTTLILNGLDDAMRNTGVFPSEIVCDKHSFHKTAIAARLKAETEKMGATWTVSFDAQRNAIAERYNQYLDCYCKEYDGYLGKNITAKSKDARPAPEAIEQYRKTANHKTVDEIKAIASAIVLQFNKEKLSALGGISPNEAYAASEDKNCFAVSEAERVELVRPGAAYKVIRGQINIVLRKKKYEFQLSSALADRYNDREVFVVYEDLLLGIYISDIMTGEQLGCVPLKDKIYGAIADQTEADNKKLHKQAARRKVTYTKGVKDAEKAEQESLQENPEAAEIMSRHLVDKSIYKEAMQNGELKRELRLQGINPDMLTDRSAEKVEEQPAATGKTKDSPFTPKNHVARPTSYAEILRNFEQ